MGNWNLVKTYADDVDTMGTAMSENNAVSCTFNADGTGTYHEKGASLPITWYTSARGNQLWVNGDYFSSYEWSGNTHALTLRSEDDRISGKRWDFSKGDVPSTSAARDSALVGTWHSTMYSGDIVTFMFNSNGDSHILLSFPRGKAIWGAELIWWTESDENGAWLVRKDMGSLFSGELPLRETYKVVGGVLILYQTIYLKQ